MIQEGKVTVNGSVAEVGQSVDPAKDVIAVEGKKISRPKPAWIALNKPVGYVVSKTDEKQRATVFDLLPDIPGITYVGRLDFLTGGLLILTNDGELANLMTHPRYQVEKAYLAVVRGGTPREIELALADGVEVEGREVAIKRFKVEAGGKGTAKIDLVITEGRNRIVRRLCGELGLEVVSLQRTAHGPIKLDGLREGKWRFLRPDELKRINALKKHN